MYGFVREKVPATVLQAKINRIPLANQQTKPLGADRLWNFKQKGHALALLKRWSFYFVATSWNIEKVIFLKLIMQSEQKCKRRMLIHYRAECALDITKKVRTFSYMCLKCLFVRYFGLSHHEASVILVLYFRDFFKIRTQFAFGTEIGPFSSV